MLETTNLIGALTAITIYLSSILMFIFRLLKKPILERSAGIATLLAGFPLVYLLLQLPQRSRSTLYYIQIGVMLLWIIVCLLVDNVIKIEFRENLRAVIAYVVLFFAGIGGMFGVAAEAGQVWLLIAVVLFFVTTIVAFIQRAVTGK